MRAAVIKQPNSEIEIEERDRPSPGRGEVLIRVRACGVCHGDLMVQQGHFPFARYPIVPGHEVAGVVEAVGEGVESLKSGHRVGLSPLFSSCGHCRQCVGGDEILCTQWEFTGVARDGGYQEFMIANAAYVTPLPDELEFAEAAPMMCAGLTVYSALRHAGFKPGDKAAIIGLGGLGEMGVLFARAMGGRVAVLSTTAEKEVGARELGAEKFINLKAEPAGEALAKWDGGADVILSTASALDPVSEAFSGLAANGTLVVLGVGPGQITIDPMVLIMGRRRLMGSPAGSLNDLRETLQFATANKLRPRLDRMPLQQANEALVMMNAGQLRGRAVLVMN